MQVIGFNLKKILAEKSIDFKRGPVNTNIEFTDVTNEKSEMLNNLEILKINYTFSINYSKDDKKDSKKMAEILFKGDLAFSADKEEILEITDAWKDKKIPEKFKLPLINFILKKCSTKALLLEEELNIPAHMPFPQLRKENIQS